MYVHCIFVEQAHVRCSQTGKVHTVKVKDLSREDGEALTQRFLDWSIIMHYRGKYCESQFVSYKGELKQILFKKNMSQIKMAM